MFGSAPTTSLSHAQGRLTPPGIRRKYPEWEKSAENLVRYAVSIGKQPQVDRIGKQQAQAKNIKANGSDQIAYQKYHFYVLCPLSRVNTLTKYGV